MNAELIERLGLEKHPEGGYYRRTYCSDRVCDFEGKPRAIASAIHYYLSGEDFSAWHRVRSDEMWHHYSGAPVSLHMLPASGELQHVTLGDPSNEHHVSQVVVPAGVWFSAELSCSNTDALMGCTLAPAFEFEDFELAEVKQLQQQYPQHKEIIRRLIRD